MALIVAGVLVLNLLSKSVAHGAAPGADPGITSGGDGTVK
jgi:hypothetical protein